MHDSSYCFSHNPDAAEQKALAVLRGGLAPKKVHESLDPVEIKTPADVLRLLEDTINRVRSAPFTHQKANSVGYLANCALKAFESAELADRVRRLEEQLNSHNP